MMSTKLSDYSIDALRAMLRATEQAAGVNSVSARLIRRELDRKLSNKNGKCLSEGGPRQ